MHRSVDQKKAAIKVHPQRTRRMHPLNQLYPPNTHSFVSDGWKDAKNQPLINVIAMSPKGAMLLKAIDCEREVKDSQFISNILIEVIDMVSFENVVQVVIYNAKIAGELVLWLRVSMTIFWTPCTIHSLNLIMQQIGTQIDWVKQIYKEGEDRQMFVTNHNMSQFIFRTYSHLELLKVN